MTVLRAPCAPCGKTGHARAEPRALSSRRPHEPRSQTVALRPALLAALARSVAALEPARGARFIDPAPDPNADRPRHPRPRSGAGAAYLAPHARGLGDQHLRGH